MQILKKKYRFVLWLCLAGCLWACVRHIKLLKPDQQLIDSLKHYQLSLVSKPQPLLASTGGSLDEIQQWSSALFPDSTDEQLRNNLIYLGPSVDQYLGSIVTSNKFVTVLPISQLTGNNSSLWSKMFVNARNGQLRELDIPTGLSIDNFIRIISVRIDTGLRRAMTEYDSVKVENGSWQLDTLNIAAFQNLIDDAAREDHGRYVQELYGKNKLVVNKVVVVNGLSADIYPFRPLAKATRSELRAGKVIRLPQRYSEDVVSAHLSLRDAPKTIIHLSFEGSFYVFATVLKANSR